MYQGVILYIPLGALLSFIHCAFQRTPERLSWSCSRLRCKATWVSLHLILWSRAASSATAMSSSRRPCYVGFMAVAVRTTQIAALRARWLDSCGSPDAQSTRTFSRPVLRDDCHYPMFALVVNAARRDARHLAGMFEHARVQKRQLPGSDSILGSYG